MGIRDSIESAVRYLIWGDLNQRDAAGAQVIGGGARTVALWPDYGIDGQVERAYKLAVALACIDRIALDASAAPLRVYREVDAQPELIPRHNARDLIAEPNPMLGESEFWYLVVATAATAGFCVVEKVRSAAGRPVQLWPLHSPWLKVLPRDQSAPAWRYEVPGNDPWTIEPEDAIVVTYRPSKNPHEHTGRSPLSSIKREMQIDDQLSDFLSVLIDRGGVPPIGLQVQPDADGKVRKIDKAERDMILETFSQRYGGFSNWSRPAFLGGLEVKQIGLDLGQMLYPDVRDAIETHICSAFGVPPGLIGTMAGLARNTFSNYESSVQQYYAGTISPLWSRLDSALTRGLLREFDQNRQVIFLFDTSDIEALREDDGPKHEQARGGLAAGYMTIDDARQHVGLAPLPGKNGEVLLLPFAAIPTRPEDLLGMAEIPEAPEEPTQEPTPDANAEPVSDAEAVEDADTTAERFAPYRAGNRVEVRLKPEYRAMLHVRSKKDVLRLSKIGTSRLRTFWKKQGQRIAEEATRSTGDLISQYRAWVKQEEQRSPHTQAELFATRALEAIDWDAEESALGKVLNAYYDLNGQTAYAAASATVGTEIDWNLTNPLVRQLMGRLGLRIKGISDTTRQDVQRVVADAIEEGVNLTEMAARLETLFEQTYRGRAMVVARTESQVAYNSAALTGYEETGLVAEAELLDNPNHGDYEGDGDGLTCAQRNGMVVTLSAAQASVEGTHPNCILAVAPVLITALGEE